MSLVRSQNKKINTEMFLYNSNKQWEKEYSLKKIPFKLASINIEPIGTNLTKYVQHLYIVCYKNTDE